MTILYYDETKSKELTYKMLQQLQQVTGDSVIALPKNYDILLDCSIDQLLTARSIIDTAISLKMDSETSSKFLS